MKIFIILLIMLIATTVCAVEETQYYCPERNFGVIHYGKPLTDKEVRDKYDLYEEGQPLTLERITLESSRYAGSQAGGKLTKYDADAQNAQLAAEAAEAELAKKQPGVDKLKTLGLTDQQLKDLFDGKAYK